MQQFLREDYPRPQWKRDNWICLNGKWKFAFDFSNSGEWRDMTDGGDYPLEINVPFCPESKLSGIEYKDFIPAVWYKRIINVDAFSGRMLIHFGAVDYFCRVFVNGKLAGTHTGGYTSFTFDITDLLCAGENTIVVQAVDDLRSGRQAFGKQSELYNSYACSYTRTTGIWQTVWLENVPDKYLESSKSVPNAKDGTLNITVYGKNTGYGDSVRVTAFYKGKNVGKAEGSFCGRRANLSLAVNEKHLWDVGKPELYDLSVELVSDGKIADKVESYFALRDVSLSDRALVINGKSVFMRLILDQGFNPDGIYTAPDDDFLRRDIELSMSLGFNGARFHQRVFEDRSLYWADRLGYIVWGEYPGGVGNTENATVEQYVLEWAEFVEQSFNHPSIIGWCALNETYFAAYPDGNLHTLFYRTAKIMDDSRPVIDASGGMHFETDMFDVHDYEQDPQKFYKEFEPMISDNNFGFYPMNKYQHTCEYKGQPYWVSEYGGTFWDPKNKGDGWGYGDTPKTEEEFAERYYRLTKVLTDNPRICGFCYTQLTDIEQEQNGLYFYDRTFKFSDFVYEKIREANTAKAEIEK